MAADVAKLCASLDKIFKSFSTQEVQLDPKEMTNLRDRGTIQYVEQKFQAHLQRARAAFLQEFRNHAVVVETEVKKIRNEMTEQMEEKYGKMLGELRTSVLDSEGVVQSQKAEISQLKGVVASQESYMTAAKNQEQLQEAVRSLETQLESARVDILQLKHQLAGREDLVSQLRGELAFLSAEVQRSEAQRQEEQRLAEERLSGAQKAMQQHQKLFTDHMQRYSQEFSEYKEKTSDQLQILAILNRRLKEALRHMEQERQRHAEARAKPSPRIGEVEEEIEEEEAFEPYVESAAPAYRTDDMGMDTAWRDYKISNFELDLPAKPPPKFKVERVRRVLPMPAPIPTMETPRPMRLLQLPAVSPALGGILSPRPR
ncbi:unnamed protein product [Effrenium voratum]|uniref:Uncharacterized protein n=1 Tax=Effrenium voratum TaxID=2562239 RepID=A0AA36NIG4_9DINO|nr:unnamed protein product [Effrenium voratum]CAJ1408154.1 unnamed protein product [Effrenium voratum]CAJ1453625.1 unnamed protein product [Effrenium voratum]